MFHTVYKTTNLVNNKIYIGVHAIADLAIDDGYLGSGLAIKGAIKKHGKENFKKEILAAFVNRDSAYLMEAALVHEEFVLREYTYNMAGGGRGVGFGANHPNYGKHHSEETKAKLSNANSGDKSPRYGKKDSEETRKKKSDAMQGRTLSEEWKQKISETKKGVPCPEEQKQKISEALKGDKNHWFGKLLSEEHKQKISEAEKGKKESEETRKKKSDARLGEKNPNFGKKTSPETKQKMSEARKEYWRKRRELS